jgi:transcriptional regulator with XRE-family HTH domain
VTQRQLTGSRIRERRLDAAIRQADLAKAAGISASYLNLIEHNRRRIGGRVLNDLARALGLDPTLLSEGAETALIQDLRGAAATRLVAEAEVDRTEEFAGRFPGWAGLVTDQAAQIARLEAKVKSLTDRMAHDPQLATSLHEVISAVTSIRSTSSILVGGEVLDRDWQERFHRNIYNDSQRLADSSRALVGYLEAPADGGALALSPVEEVDAYFDRRGHHIADLEGPEGPVEALIADAGLATLAAETLLQGRLALYRDDARVMPLADFEAAAIELRHDPALLAARFGVGPAAVLRRLSSLPERPAHPAFGFASCDGAGAVTRLKMIEGFNLPRAAAACPVWPLFQALSRPGQPIRAVVALPGEGGRRYLCHATAGPLGPVRFDGLAPVEAVMLVQAAPTSETATLEAGGGCRICPRSACPARREPSLLA